MWIGARALLLGCWNFADSSNLYMDSTLATEYSWFSILTCPHLRRCIGLQFRDDDRISQWFKCCVQKILQNGTKGLLNSFTATQQHSSSFAKPIQGFSTLHRQQTLEWRCRRSINAHRKGSRNFTKSSGQSAHFDEDVVWKGEARAIRSSWALRADILGQLRHRSQVECSASTSAGGAFEGYCEAENIQPHGVGNGIIKDIQRRFPHYASDFTDGLHPKAASAILYMTFSSLAPCFAFGGSVPFLSQFKQIV